MNITVYMRFRSDFRRALKRVPQKRTVKKVKAEARTADYIFVLHLDGKLAKKLYGSLNKGGADNDCSSI
jgi:hypothetical protein